MCVIQMYIIYSFLINDSTMFTQFFRLRIFTTVWCEHQNCNKCCNVCSFFRTASTAASSFLSHLFHLILLIFPTTIIQHSVFIYSNLRHYSSVCSCVSVLCLDFALFLFWFSSFLSFPAIFGFRSIIASVHTQLTSTICALFVSYICPNDI